jgi:hypothetical protein
MNLELRAEYVQRNATRKITHEAKTGIKTLELYSAYSSGEYTTI